jgi:hypothetical protein
MLLPHPAPARDEAVLGGRARRRRPARTLSRPQPRHRITPALRTPPLPLRAAHHACVLPRRARVAALLTPHITAASPQFPVLDTDPHFRRVVSYMRPSDHLVWAGAAGAFPGAIYAMGECAQGSTGAASAAAAHAAARRVRLAERDSACSEDAEARRCSACCCDCRLRHSTAHGRRSPRADGEHWSALRAAAMSHVWHARPVRRPACELRGGRRALLCRPALPSGSPRRALRPCPFVGMEAQSTSPLPRSSPPRWHHPGLRADTTLRRDVRPHAPGARLAQRPAPRHAARCRRWLPAGVPAQQL